MTQQLWIGNLPYAATEEDIRALFSDAGVSIERLRMIRDRETRQFKGFAYADVANADRALTLDGTRFMGRSIKVERVRERASA